MLETEPRIVDTYVKAGRVQLIFRHILDYGAPSLLASQSAECAGDQNQFWSMHELLFKRQDQVWTGSIDLFTTWASQDLHLEADAFAACLRTGKYKSKVEGVYAAARASGVRTRPTFDINGKRVLGALAFEEFTKIIDAVP